MKTINPLWCVVPAAGQGSRFGGVIPKQYLSLAGRPLILHTLERLATHPLIGGLMVVLAAEDAHWVELSTLASKSVLTTIGGAERADSVLKGLYALSALVQEDEFVLVHDAARPCVRHDDITRLITEGTQAGGALLATPLRDTLKSADSLRRVITTEPREARWRALTPQMFLYGELVRALQQVQAQDVVITDEAMAMEHAGHRPLLVEGADDNIKITTPADMALAEFLL